MLRSSCYRENQLPRCGVRVTISSNIHNEKCCHSTINFGLLDNCVSLAIERIVSVASATMSYSFDGVQCLQTAAKLFIIWRTREIQFLVAPKWMLDGSSASVCTHDMWCWIRRSYATYAEPTCTNSESSTEPGRMGAQCQQQQGRAQVVVHHCGLAPQLQPASAHHLPVPKEACNLEQPACTSSRTETLIRKKTCVGGVT